jgi:hypothetical protein
VLTAAAAAPRPAGSAPHQPAASTSGRGALEAGALRAASAAADAAAAAIPDGEPQVATGVALLPERDYGNLRGGQYPFLYDPVYGLPVVREVVRYGELLRDIRQGQVRMRARARRAVELCARLGAARQRRRPRASGRRRRPAPGSAPQKPPRPPQVSQLLWFYDPSSLDAYYLDGRCLVRYKDGRVRQSVVPPGDVRVPYAMDAHGVVVCGA